MKKMIIIASICLVLIVVVCLPFKNNNAKQDPRGRSYAGAEACAKCHSDMYNSYLHTAHYIASIPASDNTVHGSFIKGFNVFNVTDSQQLVMEKRDSGLFQTYYLNGKLKDRYSFDIVFGGVKGESYLYWQGNELYQLPISYYTAQHQWSTSPGYGFNFLDYPVSRIIKKRCLECHASFIDDLPGESSQPLNKTEEFDKSTMVLSIDCERCHGPGEQHVQFQTDHPEIKTASFITSYNSLNRIQKMDMCAVCHSGKSNVMLRSIFTFMPGDTFAKFKVPQFFNASDTNNNVDVHGNQVQLLEKSECYLKSNMTCTTCHDVHQNTRGNDILYTQVCLTCHTKSTHNYCKMANEVSDASLKTNCINCHMPALATNKISVQISDTLPSIQFFVHTHHIAVYPQETKKILAFINK
ncbi:MAG: multiheme c-type cytochrome [Parafilimonas sp.]